MANSLHHTIRKLAEKRPVQPNEFKPNSREIVLRMIDDGRLVKVGKGYMFNEVKNAIQSK
jgi:hypothetical protein